MMAVLVLMAATIGGALATYFVDDRSRVYYRLAAGACIGNTVLGLVGYILAAWMGMSASSVAFATLLVLMTPALVDRRLPARLMGHVDEAMRRGVRNLRLGGPGLRLRAALFLSTLVLLWPLYDRAMYEKPDGI